MTPLMLLLSVFTAPQGLAQSPVAPATVVPTHWWKAPSGSKSCLPDEQVAGCRVLSDEAELACYCPFPQH